MVQQSSMGVARGDVAAARVAATGTRLVELRDRLHRLDVGDPATWDDVQMARSHAVDQAQACVAARERLVTTHRIAARRHLQLADVLAGAGFDGQARGHREAAQHELEAAVVASVVCRQEQEVLAEVQRVAAESAGTTAHESRTDGNSGGWRRFKDENERLREAIATWLCWSGDDGRSQDEHRRRLCHAVVGRTRVAGWQGWTHAVCAVATTHLSFVRGAAVSAYSSGQPPELIAASDGWAARVEEIQNLVGEGPSVSAYRSNVPVAVENVDASPTLWPGYAGAVARTGVHGLWAFPVVHGGSPVACLTLYHHPQASSDEAGWHDAGVLADIAGSAMLVDVDALEQGTYLGVDFYRFYIASGVLSSRLGITTEEAAARIRAHAFSSGSSLSVMARAVIDGDVDLS
jgi:hypothetical protein